MRAVYREWARGNFRAGEDILAPDLTFVTHTVEGDDVTYHAKQSHKVGLSGEGGRCGIVQRSAGKLCL